MTLLRKSAVVLLGIAAVYSIYHFCYVPYRCQITIAQLEALTERAASMPTKMDQMVLARRALDTLQPCARSGQCDVDTMMLLAANQRLIGRSAEAAATYSEALRYERRPEIYLNLGEALLQTGRQREATDAFIAASLFNRSMVAEIPDATAHDLADEAVQRYEREIRARK